MKTFIKLIISIGLVVFSFNLIDNQSRDDGFVGAVTSLIACVVGCVIIFRAMWIPNEEDVAKQNQKEAEEYSSRIEAKKSREKFEKEMEQAEQEYYNSRSKDNKNDDRNKIV